MEKPPSEGGFFLCVKSFLFSHIHIFNKFNGFCTFFM